ncbi:hypothetical protein KQH50_01830 [bacterium]|nr:hypothetical protein [bacterium]
MKRKTALILTMLALVFAALACQLPWQPATPTPTDEVTPTEATTEPPLVTETETATEPPTETATEEPTPALPVVVNPEIFNFTFFTPTRGWATTQNGNTILVTVDGGQTWLDATPPAAALPPTSSATLSLSPFYLDENTAWVSPGNFGSGSGTIYHTQDGGVSWSENPTPFDNARYFFLDTMVGYAIVDLGAGAGSQYVAIYQTTDGGGNWTQVFTHEPGESKSLPESGHKAGITFLDMNHGWIGGDNPMTDYFYFHYTTDGGATWAEETDIALPAEYSGSFLSVRQPIFVGGTVGYLPVGVLTADSNSYLLIYRTDDSGQTWVFQGAVSGSVQDNGGVDFYAPDSGWIAAGTSLYRSTDNGLTWSPVAGSGIPASETLLKVSFADADHGWVLGTPDSNTWTPLNFYRTTDGGASWTQLLP